MTVFNGESTWVARTKVEAFLDEYQRPTKVVDHGQTSSNGNGASNLAGDERTTVYSYDDRTGPWVMGLTDEVDTHEGTTTAGTVIGSVDTTYNTLGLVSETATQRESNSTDRQRTTFTYTAKGQVATRTDHGDYSTSSDDQVTSYDYDSTYGWLSEVDGPLTGSPDPDLTQQTVDPVFGVTTQTIDPNGRVTDLTYDSLGRLLTVRLPDTPAGYNSYEFEYLVDQNAVDRVRTKQLVSIWESDKYATSWEFFDGLGRAIQSQSRHQGDDTKVAVVSTNYDALGRAWHTTRPIYRTATPGTYYSENWSNLGVAHTVSTYPAVTTSSLRSEGCDDGINTETSFRTDTLTEWATALTTSCGLTTRSWNRDGQLTKSLSDVRGNTLTSADTGGNTTTYEYDVRGQLVEVTDPASNTTTYTYANWNAYGPTQIDDPDHGVTTLAYDDFGRLERSTDARGVELARGYDDANRLDHVWQVDGANWLDVAEYKYDFSGGLGQLGEEISWNRDMGGTSAGQTSVSYTYHGRGRTETITHDIPGLPGGPQAVTYDYYEHDQPIHITYPDGTDLEYGYDRQGRPAWLGLTDPNNTAQSSTRTVVLYAEYNAADQLTTLKRRHGTRNLFSRAMLVFLV